MNIFAIQNWTRLTAGLAFALGDLDTVVCSLVRLQRSQTVTVTDLTSGSFLVVGMKRNDY